MRSARKFHAIRTGIVALAIGLLCACDRTPVAPPATPGATQPSVVTVASLVPAASELILGMGAGDRLVAVSNFDLADDRTAALPRVGDYQTIDWEKLAEVRPGAMVVQFDANRIPPGLQQRASSLGIAIINIRNNRLDEVFKTIEQIGDGLNFPTQKASATLRGQLDRVAASVAGKPPVRTLILTDDRAKGAAGPETFLDDLLTIAGGMNVLADATTPYPQVDREQLRALAPEAIIALRPAATPQEVEQTRATLAMLTDLPAVRNGRVYILTEPWALLPGWRVGELAERFAAALHPPAATATHATTSPTPAVR
ncbi:MAG TPA: helical backbone metal receptor [Tepidisphaeraceae bacterium]|nr:helical backbone metal receptor [Tepidisphaeraceae bacterium]